MIIKGRQVQNRTATKIACYCESHATSEHVMSREELAQLSASRDPGALPFYSDALRAWPLPVRLAI